jgi:hypothetical protein
LLEERNRDPSRKEKLSISKSPSPKHEEQPVDLEDRFDKEQELFSDEISNQPEPKRLSAGERRR